MDDMQTVAADRARSCATGPDWWDAAVAARLLRLAAVAFESEDAANPAHGVKNYSPRRRGVRRV